MITASSAQLPLSYHVCVGGLQVVVIFNARVVLHITQCMRVNGASPNNRRCVFVGCVCCVL